MSNDYAIAYERKKTLVILNQALEEHLPKLFPGKARLSNIWEGTVKITVDEEIDKPSVQKKAAAIIKVLQKQGVSTACQVDVSVGERFVRSRPTERFHVSKLLSASAGLYSIKNKAFRLREFNQRLSDKYGPPFPEQAQVANYKDGVITLVAKNAAVATRLRYAERQLLETAMQLGVQGAVSIVVRVTPLNEPPRRQPRKATVMSKDSADMISSTAEHIEDEGLKKALMRLSTRINNRGETKG